MPYLRTAGHRDLCTGVSAARPARGCATWKAGPSGSPLFRRPSGRISQTRFFAADDLECGQEKTPDPKKDRLKRCFQAVLGFSRGDVLGWSGIIPRLRSGGLTIGADARGKFAAVLRAVCAQLNRFGQVETEQAHDGLRVDDIGLGNNSTLKSMSLQMLTNALASTTVSKRTLAWYIPAILPFAKRHAHALAAEPAAVAAPGSAAFRGNSQFILL